MSVYAEGVGLCRWRSLAPLFVHTARGGNLFASAHAVANYALFASRCPFKLNNHVMLSVFSSIFLFFPLSSILPRGTSSYPLVSGIRSNVSLEIKKSTL
jgi:hypothetical protein